MTLTRERRPELMDRSDAEPDELWRSLRDLERVNRWLGGSRTACEQVLRLARTLPSRPVTVLDVATGGGDIPLALVRRARRLDVAMQVTATDLHPVTLRYAREMTAREPNIEVAPADALSLPFGDDSFDVVMCNTTLHHFEDEAAARAIREMNRVARGGVVLTDLVRSRLALLGARLLAVTVWRSHPITRHDGPSSVRAAFTPEELEALVRSSVDENFTVRRHPVFRMSLVVDRTV